METKIIIFTDLHYGEDIINKSKEGINTHGNTKNKLTILKNEIIKLNPFALINLGDLTFGNSKDEKISRYLEIQNIFKPIDTNIYNLIGNHELFLTGKNDLLKLINHKPYLSFIKSGYKHIILDIEKIESGFQVPKNTIDWLKNEINKDELPIIIYSHYPISEEKENISYYHKNKHEKSFLKNSKEIKNILKKSKCKLFISGHTHFYYNKMIDGIKNITIPSFSEDNNGKPSGSYGVLNLNTLEIEIKNID